MEQISRIESTSHKQIYIHEEDHQEEGEDVHAARFAPDTHKDERWSEQDTYGTSQTQELEVCCSHDVQAMAEKEETVR